ncbi:AfsR/SARP family transcriptional regulator [Streptacidiphilus albus]|uniref:AfsR/SARP family transcriptional regulator n=1 Tax=Streptacidiphilus albus TaxID=105425 RepID=UPI0005A9A57F|nr:BTAD domain-containing putative transcriptional regulator [Streptacidiphilus albus]
MHDNDRVQYGILGTTQAIRDDGTPVPLAGARLRALLAALALRAGRAVPAWALIDEVWAEEPPGDPQDALQTLVARLRRALGADQVLSAPEGYRLASADTDLRRFETLAAQEGAEAAALALWRGPALADLPSRADAAARCEAQRDAVRRRLLAAELARGRTGTVLEELAALVELQPLDEALQALRLRALQAAGRTAEALLGYEEFRRRLAEELGADPGAELRAVHAELLAPSGAAAGARGGAQAVGARAGAQDAPSAPKPRGDGPVRTNIRPRLTSFVGRDAELAALRAELPRRRLLTLTGPGGSGKTRLAEESAASRPADSCPDGVWLVELAPLDDPSALPDAVLSALGLRATALHVTGKTDTIVAVAEVEQPLDRLLDHCASRRLLIVLDNCEHLVQAAAELVEQLIMACPGVSVLATSREPLGVPGEALVPVEPLPDPAALRLLAERGAVDPEQDPVACTEICRRLDGLPLAIELAAARLRAMTPRQLADRLDARFELLTGGSRTHLPRQQTLRAVVDWSWELLDKPERLLLARLQVFAGGWTLEAAEQVCADEQLPHPDIAPLLASLVDKSLVQVALDAAVPRYRMLETIHEYAEQRFQEAADGSQLTDRHIRHYRELARTTDPLLRGAGQLAALDRLELEHDNLRAALRRAVATGDEQEASSLLLSLCWFWQLRGYEAEATQWTAAVMALGPGDALAAESGPPTPLPEGPLDLAPPWPAPVLAEARRAVEFCYYLLGQSEGLMAPTEESRQYGRQILAAYPPELPQSARLPGLLRVYSVIFTGDFEAMGRSVDELVDCCRAFGRPWELAYALQMRCKFSNDQVGGLERARADVQESLDVFTRLGDSWGMAEALAGQAETAAFTGDFALAVAASRRAVELARSVGALQDLPMLLVRLGDSLLGLGEFEEGERQLRAGVAAAAGTAPRTQGAAFYGSTVLSLLAAREGRLQEARALLEPLRDNLAVSGMGAMLVGMVEAVLGRLDAVEGRPHDGLRRMRAGLKSMDGNVMSELVGAQLALQLAPTAAAILFECARADASGRSPEGAGEAAGEGPGASASAREPGPAWRAAALLGAAGRQLARDASHHLERESLAETVAGLRELLGEQAYAAARAEGESLDTAAVAALLRDA